VSQTHQVGWSDYTINQFRSDILPNYPDLIPLDHIGETLIRSLTEPSVGLVILGIIIFHPTLKGIRKYSSQHPFVVKTVNSNPSYIKKTELLGFFRLIIWLFGITQLAPFFVVLHHRVLLLWKKNGSKFVVLYLKETVRLLYHFISGRPSKSTRGTLVKVTAKGIPMIIPKELRKYIIEFHLSTIKGLLSVLTVYRVIYYPSKVDLGPIVRPCSGLFTTLPLEEVSHLWKTHFHPLFRRAILPAVSLRFISKAGPNGNPSWTSLLWDGLALVTNSTILEAFKTVAKRIPQGLELVESLNQIKVFETQLLAKAVHRDPEGFILGKLAEKPEPAGKIRIFGITDWWTQMVLYPLHLAIFSVLKKIKNDGTFNQAAPLHLLNDILRGSKRVFSFDLSQATDRLPIDLQVQILSLWLGEEFAKAWKVLLVSRPWYHKGQPVFYGVGQPMGAYSSWAMLALTHHFIIQFAAMRAGWECWFPFYAVLGDDVVIYDDIVAHHYTQIMKGLGVTINMTKSLESDHGVFEYAKRLISPHAEFTPVGAANVLLALRHWYYIPVLFLDLFGKGRQYSIHTIRLLLQTLSRWGPKGLSKANVKLIELVMLLPGGVLSQFWVKIKYRYDISNITSLTAGGPQSASFQSWLQAVQEVLRLKGLRYVQELRKESLRPLSDILCNFYKENQKIRLEETDFVKQTFDSYFSPKSVHHIIYEQTKERLLDWKVVSLLLKGYWPDDTRSVNVADPGLQKRYSSQVLSDFGLASKVLDNPFLDSGYVWDVNDVPIKQARLFAVTSKDLIRRHRVAMRHFRLVNRENLPVVSQHVG